MYESISKSDMRVLIAAQFYNSRCFIDALRFAEQFLSEYEATDQSQKRSEGEDAGARVD